MGSSTKEAMLVRTRLTLFTLWAVTLCVLPGCTTQSDLTGISDTGAALRIAAFRGDLGEVNTLIENEASINAANKDGVTPLFMAAQNGHRDTVAALLDHGADAKQGTTSDGITPLFIAAQRGHREVVALLLDHGADPKQARKNDGATPLFMAAQNGYRDIVALLLDHGADVKQGTMNGRTALHVAAFYGRREIVAILLKQGADKSARMMPTGQRPVDLARQRGHSTLVSLLEP
jgi:ankyrin repeat protein